MKEAIDNVQNLLKQDGLQFHKKLSSSDKARQPLSSLKYRPELDMSVLCNEEQSAYFMNLIGVL